MDDLIKRLYESGEGTWFDFSDEATHFIGRDGLVYARCLAGSSNVLGPLQRGENGWYLEVN